MAEAVLGFESFEPLASERLAVALEPSGSTVLEFHVKEVKFLGEARDGGRQPFAVLFSGPTDSPLGQGTVWLSHPSLGTQSVFIVPVGVNEDHRLYEAVFN